MNEEFKVFLWVVGVMALAFVLAGVGNYASAHDESVCPPAKVAIEKPVTLRLIDVFDCGIKTCRFEFVGPRDAFVLEVPRPAPVGVD